MALTDNCVAYWNLDEASGNRADATGRGNTATAVGSPGSAAGKVGNALDSTETDYLEAASSSDLQSGDIDFTLAGWIWFDDISVQHDILGKWASGELEYFIFKGSNDKLKFFVSTNGSDFPGIQADSFGTVSTNTWYFVVGWHDAAANTLNIQVNDGTVDSTAHSAGVRVGTAPFRFGKFDFGKFHDGRLDEVGLWKRVLTAGERTTLYNGGAGLAYPFGAAAAPHRLTLLGIGI